MLTVSTSNVTVEGRNGGNGVTGLPEQATFAARTSPETGHCWFAGYQPTGSVNAVIPLPSTHGTVKNMATGQLWNVTDGLVTAPIGSSGDLYFFIHEIQFLSEPRQGRVSYEIEFRETFFY